MALWYEVLVFQLTSTLGPPHSLGYPQSLDMTLHKGHVLTNCLLGYTAVKFQPQLAESAHLCEGLGGVRYCLVVQTFLGLYVEGELSNSCFPLELWPEEEPVPSGELH